MTNLGILIEVVAFAVTIGAAAVWLRSSIAKQRTTELASLAETRGYVIDDLRTELQQLRSEVAELKGALQSLEALKVQEMADRAVEAIIPFLLTADEKEKLRSLLRTNNL